MFNGCISLTHLPDNFTIPNNIYTYNKKGMFSNCRSMFNNCKSLTKLPDNFTIPNNYTTYIMFSGCTSLTHLPDNFKFSNNVTDYNSMFSDCTSLKNN